MANSFRAAYAVCPYFLGEKRKSITCEDIYRGFNSIEAKNVWMDNYCCKDWEDCLHARRLTDAYRKLDEGDIMALKDCEIDSLQRELKRVSSRIGKVEKDLRKTEQKNVDLENQKRIFFEKYRKAKEQLDDYEKHESERYITMAMLYEDRIAYLIDTYCNGRLEEEAVKAWAKDKEYALTFDKDSKDPIWIVQVRDAEEETDGHEEIPEKE